MTQALNVLNADQPVRPRSIADSGERIPAVVIATRSQVGTRWHGGRGAGPSRLKPPRRAVAERGARVLGYGEPNDWLMEEGPDDVADV
jgi:hypothetical protein